MKSILERVVFIAIASAATAYLLIKVLYATSDTIDFRYIWLAGSLWNSSVDPYTDAYRIAGEQIFVGFNPPVNWVYPPNFWVLSAPISLLPYDLAAVVWRGASALLTLLGVLILYRGCSPRGNQSENWSWLLFYVFATASSAAAISLSLGQTSSLVFLGVCMFTAAFVSNDKRLMIGALVLLALKPTFVLPLGAFLAAQKAWRGTSLAAASIVVVLCIPAFIVGGFLEVIQGFLIQLRGYQGIDINTPPAMTGVRNLLHHTFSLDVPPIPLILFCSLLSGILGALLEYRIAAAPVRSIVFILFALIVFFVPLHTYDFIFMGVFLILVQSWSVVLKSAILVSILLIVRVNNLSDLIGRMGLAVPGELFAAGSLIVSLVSLLLLMIASLKLRDFLLK